jgi:hypothetical protein
MPPDIFIPKTTRTKSANVKIMQWFSLIAPQKPQNATTKTKTSTTMRRLDP